MNCKRLLIFIIVSSLCTTISEELHFINNNGQIVKRLYLDDLDLQTLKEKTEYFKIDSEHFGKSRLELTVSSVNPDIFKSLLTLLTLNDKELIEKLEKFPAEKLFDIIRAADFLVIEKLKKIILPIRTVQRLAIHLISQPEKLVLLTMLANNTMCPSLPIQIGPSLVLQHDQHVWDISWSTSGKYIATLIYDTVYMWNSSTGQLEHILSSHDGYIGSILWSNNDEHVAIIPRSDNNRGVIHIWNASTGQLEQTLPKLDSVEHFTSLSWSPDYKYIAITSNDKTPFEPSQTPMNNVLPLRYKTTRIYSADTGQIEQTLESNKTPYYSVQWNPNPLGIPIFYDNGRIFFTKQPGSKYITHALPSPDGTYLSYCPFLIGGQPPIYIWSALTGLPEYALTSYYTDVKQWSPDSKHFAAVPKNKEDKTASIWSIPPIIRDMNLNEWLILLAALKGRDLDSTILKMLSYNTIDALLTLCEEPATKIRSEVKQKLERIKHSRLSIYKKDVQQKKKESDIRRKISGQPEYVPLEEK